MRGHTTSLLTSTWPEWDEERLVEERVTLIIQVDGKLRDRIEVDAAATNDAVEALARGSERVAQHLEGRELVRTVVVPGRLVNLVTRSSS